MKERFIGESGRPSLLAALQQQRVVQHQADIAAALACAGDVVHIDDGTTVMGQRADDTSAFFLLTGEVVIYVNEREVARRGPRDLIGEMAIIDPTTSRSATVKARGGVVALRVPGPELEKIAQKHPAMWRAMAQVLAERLREREKYHLPKNAKPIVFVGSSKESLRIAKAIEIQCKDDPFTIRPWTKGVFGAGGVTIDELLAQVRSVDFALFVLAPDDLVRSRGKEAFAPRDNVILELGLFMERLDRRRNLMLIEHGSRPKIPSDLLGISPLTYRRSARSLVKQLKTPCDELRKRVKELGAL